MNPTNQLDVEEEQLKLNGNSNESKILELLEGFSAEEDQPLKRKMIHSLNVISKALGMYKEEDISISFNGGKDCTVVLHLWSLLVDTKTFKSKIIYFEHQDTFEEELEFLDECIQRYNLQLIKAQQPYKDGLFQIKKDHPNVEAILMGVRRTDPYSAHLNCFQETDNNYPRFMRVNPVLDWNYCEIWKFLIRLKVPYCKLYDMGYTSLGKKTLTQKNELLRKSNGDYDPAWMLQKEHKERESRN